MTPEQQAQYETQLNADKRTFFDNEVPYFIPIVRQLLQLRDISNADKSGHKYNAEVGLLGLGASAGLGGLLGDAEGAVTSDAENLGSGDVAAIGDGSAGSLGGGSGNVLDSDSSSSDPNWVQGLVINRSVNAPETLNLGHLADVKDFLVSELGMPAKWIDNRTTIAILEQDGTWHLGLNNKLDLWTQTRLRLRGFVPSDTSIRVLDVYPYFSDFYAEPNALNELWNSGSSGNEASMVVSRHPCRLCIQIDTSPYDGTIRNGVSATGMSRLTLQFVRKIASRLVNNPATIYP